MLSTRNRRFLLLARDCYRALSAAAPRRYEPTDTYTWNAERGPFPIEIPTTVDYSFYNAHSDIECPSSSVNDGDRLAKFLLESPSVVWDDNHVELGNSLTKDVFIQNSDHNASVEEWKTNAMTSKTTAEVDLLWEKILINMDTYRSPWLIGRILSVSRGLELPSSTIAQLVCSLIRVGKFDLAEKIAQKASILGNPLISSMRRLKRLEDLGSIERLAHILSETVVAEKDARKRKSQSSENKEGSPSPETDKIILEEVAKFLGIKAQKKRKFRKRHLVNQSRLFETLERLRDIWYDMTKDDEVARQRCHQWCLRNGVESSSK